MSDSSSEQQPVFRDLGLSENVLTALDAVGYEVPTPIQAQSIPPLLEGRDLLGQAQTGTGKTAAFALPLISRLDVSDKATQVLVLTPTRELSIQVSEAFQRYAAGLKGFHVAPVYGGQDIGTQLRKLKRGVHIVVGTPGRVMDHMRRGTLKLDKLRCLVLDEADEMLKMGFVEDIEWILEAVPDETQIALFSATLPAPIRRIAHRHLENPAEITIKQSGKAVSTIRQRYWVVDGMHKTGALTRILEAEPFDGILIFVKTKTMTVELATKLEAQGFGVAPLNGDIPQAQREKTVSRLKTGKIDIVVATDVAARGLDIDRISHVINYDIPHNVEAYIHRIGRTGRAGREGDAIIFVTPRERWFLNAVKKATGREIEVMQLPSAKMVHDLRVERFKESITEEFTSEEIPLYRKIVEEYMESHGVSALDAAAALARMANAGKPPLVQGKEKYDAERSKKRSDKKSESGQKDRPEKRARKKDGISPSEKRPERGETRGRSDDKFADRKGKGRRPEGKDAPRERPKRADTSAGEKPEPKPRRKSKDDEIRMERYRVAVGKNDGIDSGALADAISREAELDRKYIGRIEVGEESSSVELPEGMPSGTFRDLKKMRLAGKPSNLTLEKPAFFEKKKKKKKKS